MYFAIRMYFAMNFAIRAYHTGLSGSSLNQLCTLQSKLFALKLQTGIKEVTTYIS